MKARWSISALALAGLVWGCGGDEEAGSTACRSDAQCPSGYYCDFVELVCRSGQALWATHDMSDGVTDVPGDATEVAPACVEGSACDDGDPCTFGDRCTNGACAGTAYSCSPKLTCVAGTCRGDGSCIYNVKADTCLISNKCHSAGDPDPGNGCRACVPWQDRYDFSDDDSKGCSDGDAATTGDHCVSGKCVGTKQS